MEIKYEAVFGDQSLFDDAHNEATHATSGHGFYKVNEDGLMEYLSNGVMNGNKNETLTAYLIAERRIIRTPTWTAADQNAGKLPEVLAKVDGGVVVFVNSFNVVTELESGAVIVSSPKTFLNTFKPIESPEEKAARLEDEFYQAVRKTCAIGSSEEQAFRLACKVAHRMMLSGDLPVPVKGE